MPRLPINYKHSMIYKIVCRDPTITDAYIGSTTDFAGRKSAHKITCRNGNSSLDVYRFINVHGGWESWDMILIESFTCTTSLELHQRERFYIDELKPTLNMRKPARSADDLSINLLQYRELHRAKHNSYALNYYQVNKIQLRAKAVAKDLNAPFIKCPCCCQSYQKHKQANHIATKHHRTITTLFERCGKILSKAKQPY